MIHETHGYYAQSGVENVFSRYKAILNKLGALGAPLSVRVE